MQGRTDQPWTGNTVGEGGAAYGLPSWFPTVCRLVKAKPRSNGVQAGRDLWEADPMQGQDGAWWECWKPADAHFWINGREVTQREAEDEIARAAIKDAMKVTL